jgi:Mg2+ and Co2+ transporter CorA
VVGSLYPALRVLSRSVTDITHPDYREMQRRLVDAFGARPNVIYACGHEHVQEHFTIADDHYIVSGAGSKWSPVRKGLQADFVHAFYGYAVLQSYADGSVWVTYYAPDRSAPQEAEEVVFRKRLY